MKDEIRQMIKRCKSNNASKSNDIFNRILKILVNKLMTHLMSLFRVCVALSYHSRCFREIHIIILKKSKKKNYTDVKTYKSIALLNTLDKVLKSMIARRISDLTKTHDLFSSIKWMNAKIAAARQFWNCWRSKFIRSEIWIKTR
jgi:hypothetical protein